MNKLRFLLLVGPILCLVFGPGFHLRSQPASDGPTMIKGELTRKAKAPGDLHEIDMKAGHVYLIDLVSDEFDPFLRLESSKGKLWAEDDDGGEGVNSRLRFFAPKTDKCKLFADSFLPDQAGKYRLTLRKIGEDNTVKETLTKKDRQFRRRQGCHAHIYHVLLQKDVDYVIELSSKDFDSYLYLETDREKKVAEDDDSGGGLNARIRYRPQSTETYRIIVTTFLPGEHGEYTLRIAAPGAKKD